MKNIVEIVPASPGWYVRWRFAPEVTRSYPVAVWALLEEDTTGARQVAGVDATGQWPGGTENEPDADFLRYIFQPPELGVPDDVSNPVQSSRAGAR